MNGGNFASFVITRCTVVGTKQSLAISVSPVRQLIL